MKTFFYSIILFLTIILSSNLNAQTDVSLTSGADYSSVTCPLPAPMYVNISGLATNYNDVTDSISVKYFWGDGSDTTIVFDLIDGGITDNFYTTGATQATHNYYLPGTYTPMVVATGPDGNDDTLYLNSQTYSTGCVIIDGDSYRDNNSNCIFDVGDDTLQWVFMKVTDLSTSTVIAYACSDISGHYSLAMPSGTGSFSIEPVLFTCSTYDEVVCPITGSYTFSPTVDMSFDFALDCSGTGHELGVWISSWADVPGGTTGFGNIFGYNFSCSSVAGTMSVTLDPNVVYTGMLYGPPPTSITGSTLTWNHVFGAYSTPTSHNYLKFNLATLTTAPVLGTACFNASIDPLVGDIYVANNTDSWCGIIGGPYDPNNKEVMPAGIGVTGDVLPNTDFDYLINFQNCGTAEAINIYIIDTISSNLDMSTFQITGSSHLMNPIITGTNLVRFDFPNIHLIDSVANETLSHGWVSYHINSKSGLTDGTQITNTGHIYFDYNAAVVTNTTLNTINSFLSIDEIPSAIENTLFPNPATNNAVIRFENNVSGVLYLVDAMGKQVKSIEVKNTNEIQISLQDLPSGFYGLTMPGIELKQNRLQIIK